MKSFLQAAESIRETTVLDAPVLAKPSSGEVDNIISSEETQEIIKEIDRLSGQSRINVTPDLFSFSAMKKGFLFPLLFNIAAVLILTGGIFATRYYFNAKDQQMLMASAEQNSVEGDLINEIKKDTEKKLAEKEDEIQNIQQNMAKVESERKDLEKNMNDKISEKEAELRRQMQAALDAERQKLQSQGMSSAQIEDQISKLELEKTSAFEQQLADYKEQAKQEKIQLEQNLTELQNEYNSKLTSVSEERDRIESEAKNREAELTAKMQAKTQELESEKTQAEQELQKLTRSKEQEDLVENQIIGYYKNIQARMKEGNLDQASAELKNLQNYLYDDSVAGLSGLTKRREVDLFVINSLSKLIDSTKAKPAEEQDTMSLIDAAARLKEIRQTVQNADQQMAVGNQEMAELLYKNALKKIPEINKSHQYFMDAMEAELDQGNKELESIQARFDALKKEADDRAKEVGTRIDEGNSNYQSGDYARALESYKKAITATGYDNIGTAAENMITSESNLAVAPFRKSIDTMTAQLDDLKKEKTGLEKSLAEKEQEIKDYNDQITGRTGDLATLNKDYEEKLAQIDNLTKQADSDKSAMSELNRKLSDEQKQVASLKEQIDQQTDTISTYEQRLEEMRLSLEEEKTKTTGSKEDSRKIDSQVAELTTLKTRLNQLNKSYTDFELIADNLDDNLKGNAATVDALYNFFSQDSVEEVMPGISDYLRSFSNVYISAGQEIGLYEAVSVLYDLNSIDTKSGKIDYLKGKLAEYKDNEAMTDIISQLMNSIKKEG